MSLDFKLIDAATAYSKSQLDQIADGEELALLTDFLYPPLVDKLIEYIHKPELKWVEDPVYRTKCRTKITWEFDTVVEEVHTVFDGITDDINRKFNRQNKFAGVSIWKDTAGYHISKHKDNRVIDVAIQIYLSSGTSKLATAFEYKNRTLQADYAVNSGYIADNLVGVYHWLPVPVPEGHTRYSIYALWSNNSKS